MPIEGLDVIRVLTEGIVAVCHDALVLWRRHVHVACKQNEYRVRVRVREAGRTRCSITVEHGFRSWGHLDGLRVEVDGLLELACLVGRVTPCLEGRSPFYEFLATNG